MRRRVDHAIRRQHAELARPANPVVGEGLAGFDVEQFDTGSSEQNKVLGGAIAIAAMMAHARRKELLIAGAGALDFARDGIQRFGDAGIFCLDKVAGPQQAVGQQYSVSGAVGDLCWPVHQ